MKSILDELWYGNIHPMESIQYNTPELQAMLRQEIRNREALEKTLSEEQKELLARLLDSYGEMTCLSERNTFLLGFRPGAQITTDVLSQ